jgi:charged multivesicular body protein 2A
MMGDAIDSAMETDAAEEDKVVNQVLDEIGINLNEMMSSAPTGKLNDKATADEEKQGNNLLPLF